jgi:hypothetical protein
MKRWPVASRKRDDMGVRVPSGREGDALAAVASVGILAAGAKWGLDRVAEVLTGQDPTKIRKLAADANAAVANLGGTPKP